MGKYFGKIGFGIETEKSDGRWVTEIVEKTYFGNVKKESYSIKNDSEINDDLEIRNQISIIANGFLNENLGRMVYVTLLGSKWKIKSVDINPPRINIQLGGLYNG